MDWEWGHTVPKAMVSPSYIHKRQYNEKHSFLQFPLLDKAIDKFFLLEVSVHICLPLSLTDVMKFAAALSHCLMHMTDVNPHKRVS